MRVVTVLAGAVLACACGARSELDGPAPHDASVPDVEDARPPHDATPDVAPVDAAPDAPLALVCTVSDAGEPKSPCIATLRVETITPSSLGCSVDSLVHEGDQGTALFDCMASGTWAEATFPSATFPGSIPKVDTLDVCGGTIFTRPDGCTWQSAQRITGNLDQKTLSFTYDEKPIAGTGCQSPCSATGTVLVE